MAPRLALVSSLLVASAGLYAASGVEAQLGGGLLNGVSSGCQTTLAGLMNGDFSTCSNVGGLVSVLSASGSIVPPLDSWVTQLCTSTTPCTNATIESTQNTIHSGCSSELSSGQPVVTLLDVIVTNYTTVRKGLCMQDSKNKENCAIETLYNIQNFTGQPITTNTITSANTTTLTQLENLPANITCTDCNHAIWATWSPLLNATNATSASGNSPSISSAVAGKCGNSFTDGKVPSTVQSGDKASSSAKGNAASSVGSLLSAGVSTGVVAAAIAGGLAILA